MSEVEKLYKNAGIVLRKCSECDNNMDCGYGKDCYPPFTAEKQLELIKWLCQHTYRNYIKFRFDICGLWYCECNMSNSDMHHTFEDALIDVLMQIWQDLSPEEKQQVKGILEGGKL